MIQAAPASADPEAAFSVFIDAQDTVVGEGGGITRMMSESGEGIVGAVEAAESPSKGADPGGIGVVDKEGVDLVMTKGGGVLGLSAIDGEFLNSRIKNIESAVPGADPEEAV